MLVSSDRAHAVIIHMLRAVHVLSILMKQQETATD